MFLTIHGERHYLWRAVAQDSHILDIRVPHRRDRKAAKKFFRKLLTGWAYGPRGLLTAKLKSYSAAKRDILPGSLHNRAEKSHQPTRQRERRMQGFKAPGHAPRFLSAYGPSAQPFRPRRHRLPAPTYRHLMTPRFQIWHEVTGTAAAYGARCRWRDRLSCLMRGSAHNKLTMAPGEVCAHKSYPGQ
jgi:putative transposase